MRPSRFVPRLDYVSAHAGSVTLPDGFRAAGIHAGIKRARPDLAILVSDFPANSSAFFTTNAAAAAPVLVTRGLCRSDNIQAVVVNSGIANAATGAKGYADALQMRELAAAALRLPEDQVAVSSTGVIGDPLPMDLVSAGILRCVAELDDDGGERFAEAIRTTDRTEKMLGLAMESRAGVVHIGFASKGAGMISPKMATTLTFVTSDAVVPHDTWHRMMAKALNDSFNRITVDGQQSTNDMVLGLANGASHVTLDEEGLERLGQTLYVGLLDMAIAVVSDGEGSTTTVRLTVTGAADTNEADHVARGIGNSPLVKAAVYGHDPNWGRILSAAGMSLPAGRRDRLACDISYGDVCLLRRGEPEVLSESDRERLDEIANDVELDLLVNLHRGTAESVLYFPDLTHDYVQLNANGRT